MERPLRRRFLMIDRPARVFIRARKPCFFDRRRLLGWNVRFTGVCPPRRSHGGTRHGTSHARRSRRVGGTRGVCRGEPPPVQGRVRCDLAHGVYQPGRTQRPRAHRRHHRRAGGARVAHPPGGARPRCAPRRRRPPPRPGVDAGTIGCRAHHVPPPARRQRARPPGHRPRSGHVPRGGRPQRPDVTGTRTVSSSVDNPLRGRGVGRIVPDRPEERRRRTGERGSETPDPRHLASPSPDLPRRGRTGPRPATRGLSTPVDIPVEGVLSRCDRARTRRRHGRPRRGRATVEGAVHAPR